MASFLLCVAAGQGYRVLREAINLTQPLHLGLLLLPLCIHAIFSPSMTCFAFSSSLYHTEVCFVVTSLHYWEPQGLNVRSLYPGTNKDSFNFLVVSILYTPLPPAGIVQTLLQIIIIVPFPRLPFTVSFVL